MNVIGAKLAESLKVILTVLGIISAYPEVTSDNFFVYRNFKDRTIINAQFSCGNLINPQLRDVIDSGVAVNIIYQVKTEQKNQIIYKNVTMRRIQFDGTNYIINNQSRFSYDQMTNIITVQELVFLTNAGSYLNQELSTEVDILLNCDATPEIINLWGNRPRIILSYNIKE